MNIISMLAIIGAVVVGFGFGTVPDWIWIPFTLFFGVGFIYTLFDDNRNNTKK